VNPHQDGQGHVVVVRGRGDDAEVEHVVARYRRLRNGRRGIQRHPLRGGTVPGRVERLGKPATWDRRGEPPGTDGCFGVGDAEEAPHPAGATADDRACGSMNGDRLAGGVE
jgi:hypothetical protein